MNVTITQPTSRHGWLHALMFALSRSRFSVLLLIAGLVLLLSDQGQDALTAYAEDHNTVRVAVAAAFWALSIWGWSRLLLDVHYEDLPSCKAFYYQCRKWIPRLLGLFAFLVLAFAAYQTEQTLLVWWTLGELAVFFVAVVVRRPAVRAFAFLLGRSHFNAVRQVAPKKKLPAEPPYTNLREMLGIPTRDKRLQGERTKLHAWIALVMSLAFFVFLALGIWEPGWLGKAGALIVFFLWAATWLPLGSWMSYVADKHDYPLISIFVVLALVSSYFNDNHEIRPAVAELPVDSRPSVTDALKAWEEANTPASKGAAPFVVVATAGGGIRAAYWTATVLGGLQDAAGKFSQRTFAISGVSGGSVGATVYRALLEVPPEQRDKAKACEKGAEKGLRYCAQSILGNDFLGPLSAALLYPDLIQRFWPCAIFPDRAAALEKSWEKAFRDAFKDVSGDKEDKLNSSLVALGNSAGKPSLFLNATWSDNGRRIVASNLRYDNKDPSEHEAFVLSNDELAELGYDLRLSTAAHNSARFPFVSPPGMWKHGGEIAGRLQDGGLFENYGAETALEILDLACREFACPGDKRNNRPKIIPVVILITSDRTLPDDLAESPQHVKPIKFGYEVRSTFRAYERVRGGRGAEAAFQLENWTKQKNKGEETKFQLKKWTKEKNHDGFFKFRMCKEGANTGQPPLGWELSDVAKARINGYLFPESKDQPVPSACVKNNMAAYQALTELLAQ